MLKQRGIVAAAVSTLGMAQRQRKRSGIGCKLVQALKGWCADGYSIPARNPLLTDDSGLGAAHVLAQVSGVR